MLVCLPLAAPIGLSPLHILTLCGSECGLVVSTEPLDDLSCLTTPGSQLSQRRALARAIEQVHPDAHSQFMLGLPRWGGGRFQGSSFRWSPWSTAGVQYHVFVSPTQEF